MKKKDDDLGNEIFNILYFTVEITIVKFTIISII